MTYYMTDSICCTYCGNENINIPTDWGPTTTVMQIDNIIYTKPNTFFDPYNEEEECWLGKGELYRVSKPFLQSHTYEFDSLESAILFYSINYKVPISKGEYGWRI